MVHVLVFLAALFFGGAAQAQCVGALQSGSNLSDVCSPSTAINNILPSQGGNSGKVLTTNGSAASWGTAAAGTVTSVAAGAGMDFSTITGTGSVAASATLRTTGIIFIIDGGGSAITTGVKGDIEIPFACTITAARVFADQSGSIVVDIWKDTYANFPPTVADTITASAKPTLSSAAKAEDTTLTGWTTSVSAGNVLRFNVDSATTVTRVTVSLTCLKS